MAEPTLSVIRDKLRLRTAAWLGYATTIAELEADTGQNDIVDDLVQSGQRMVYKSPPVPGIDPGGYDWTFLHPVGTVYLASGQSQLDLPDDFGGIEGSVTVSRTDGGAATCSAIQVVDEFQVREALTRMSTATGAPEIAATDWEAGTGVSRGQRQILKVFPVADAAYTLRFQYFLQADAITGARPYVYGGSQHGETFIAACLAAAEMYQNNERGVMYTNFLEQLAGSIRIDQRNKPKTHGYNADRSDDAGVAGSWPWPGFQFPTITIGGVTP